MKKKEYNDMIDRFIERVKGSDINIIGMLLCLKVDNRVPNNTHIKQKEVIKAQERFDTIIRLIELGLLK